MKYCNFKTHDEAYYQPTFALTRQENDAFFAAFDCPSYQFATPPIDEFLGTFTIGACGKGKTRSFILPAIAELPTEWDIWGSLKESFIFAFKKTTSQVVSALILKGIQALEAGTCQALTFAGEATQDLFEASVNGGRFPRSIAEIASDVVCGDELNEDQKNKEIGRAYLELAGYGGGLQSMLN